ncbi:CCNK [Branchiostoma lanceolatum]|uniref:CCNK protein n=1 Tax=Branchiostoma lanceolatum TaxID=7740 RepID=A0A8K0ET71_BRALA|nr:CCNK [Branchiostoma lanceolatum]
MPCWYYEKKDIMCSPSATAGVDYATECRYRREGARFIIDAGTALGLKPQTFATGVVYFHRFYMFHTFKDFNRYVTGACCLFLAGKVEETPKKCRDIIKTARALLNDKQFAPFGDDPKIQQEEVMTLERILLQTIKFDLQVEHPYMYILKYAKSLKEDAQSLTLDKNKLHKLVQMAWTFVNDSLCTTLCLQWEPQIIAIAIMHLAGRLTKFDMLGAVQSNADKPVKNWWDRFEEDVSLELLEDICHQVLDLYSQPQGIQTPSPPPSPASRPAKRPRIESPGQMEPKPSTQAAANGVPSAERAEFSADDSSQEAVPSSSTQSYHSAPTSSTSSVKSSPMEPQSTANTELVSMDISESSNPPIEQNPAPSSSTQLPTLQASASSTSVHQQVPYNYKTSGYASQIPSTSGIPAAPVSKPPPPTQSYTQPPPPSHHPAFPPPGHPPPNYPPPNVPPPNYPPPVPPPGPPPHNTAVPPPNFPQGVPPDPSQSQTTGTTSYLPKGTGDVNFSQQGSTGSYSTQGTGVGPTSSSYSADGTSMGTGGATGYSQQGYGTSQAKFGSENFVQQGAPPPGMYGPKGGDNFGNAQGGHYQQAGGYGSSGASGYGSSGGNFGQQSGAYGAGGGSGSSYGQPASNTGYNQSGGYPGSGNYQGGPGKGGGYSGGGYSDSSSQFSSTPYKPPHTPTTPGYPTPPMGGSSSFQPRGPHYDTPRGPPPSGQNNSSAPTQGLPSIRITGRDGMWNRRDSRGGWNR